MTSATSRTRAAVLAAALAFTAGGAAAELRNGLQPAAFSDSGAGEFEPLFLLNKVQKYGFGAEWTYRGEGAIPTRFRLSGLYATGTKKWYPSIFVEQPIIPGTDLFAWVRAGREAEPFAFDDHTITRNENIAAAYFLREDFMDYTEVRRAAAGLRLGPFWEQTLTAGIGTERHEPMDRVTLKAGFFGGAKSFPRNAVATAMEPTVVTLRYDWRTPGGWTPWDEERWDRRKNGVWVTWEGFWADPEIGGDVAVSRQLVEGRARWTPADVLELRFRGAIGWTPYGGMDGSAFAVYPGMKPPPEGELSGIRVPGAGRLPPQWTFHAGGIGTLRGHDDKEFVGDQLLLGNLEYAFHTSRDFAIVLFTDLGKAWYQDEEPYAGGGFFEKGSLAWDGGAGIEVGQGALRVQLAQDLRDMERTPRLTMRLQRPF